LVCCAQLRTNLAATRIANTELSIKQKGGHSLKVAALFHFPMPYVGDVQLLLGARSAQTCRVEWPGLEDVIAEAIHLVSDM
jgi:hypothetical protein